MKDVVFYRAGSLFVIALLIDTVVGMDPEFWSLEGVALHLLRMTLAVLAAWLWHKADNAEFDFVKDGDEDA